MNRTEKEQVVQELTQRLTETQAMFLADYRGINVEQATQLRRELTQAGVEYRVVKNNLLKLHRILQLKRYSLTVLALRPLRCLVPIRLLPQKFSVSSPRILRHSN